MPTYLSAIVTVKDSGHMTPAYAPIRVLHLINNTLLNNKLLSSLLPANFATVDATEFYGTEKSTGIFADWVLQNMRDV